MCRFTTTAPDKITFLIKFMHSVSTCLAQKKCHYHRICHLGKPCAAVPVFLTLPCPVGSVDAELLPAAPAAAERASLKPSDRTRTCSLSLGQILSGRD